MKQYDVAILGGGVGGATCAYKLIEENPKLKILMIDNASKYTSGWRNDCKFNDHHEIGFVENPHLKRNEIYDMNQFSLNLFRRFVQNIESPLVDPNKISDLEIKVAKAGARLEWAKQYHLGTDRGIQFTKDLYSYLIEKGVEIRTKSNVYHIDIVNNNLKKVFLKDKKEDLQISIYAKNAVVSLGRLDGESTTTLIAKALGLRYTDNFAQVGVRFECLNEDYPITEIMYDPKIYFKGGTRTFCTNPGGYVVAVEKDTKSGINLVNGHALNGKKSKNTNFALIINMCSPYVELDNSTWSRFFASNINAVGYGKPIAQRLEHFLDKIPSTNKHFEHGRYKVDPTLSRETFVAYNLAGLLHDHIESNIRNAILTLNNIIGNDQILNSDAIIYGPETKNCSTEIETKGNYESAIPGLYFIGDGSGKSRGINGASVTAQVVAKDILEKFN